MARTDFAPKPTPEYAAGCKRHKSKLSARHRRLFWAFGISEADYDFMFAYQGGACGICRTPQSDLSKALAVDHCHKTGRIRGLLCGNCNTALGLMKDSRATLARASRWLMDDKDLAEEHGSPE